VGSIGSGIPGPDEARLRSGEPRSVDAGGRRRRPLSRQRSCKDGPRSGLVSSDDADWARPASCTRARAPPRSCAQRRLGSQAEGLNRLYGARAPLRPLRGRRAARTEGALPAAFGVGGVQPGTQSSYRGAEEAAVGRRASSPPVVRCHRRRLRKNEHALVPKGPPRAQPWPRLPLRGRGRRCASSGESRRHRVLHHAPRWTGATGSW
jgi:hypothetical protein